MAKPHYKVSVFTCFYLDEPTNHLDLGAVVWLEAYLSTYNHILVITSHSQDFMDNVCTNIIELTPKKKVCPVKITVRKVS